MGFSCMLSVDPEVGSVDFPMLKTSSSTSPPKFLEDFFWIIWIQHVWDMMYIIYIRSTSIYIYILLYVYDSNFTPTLPSPALSCPIFLTVVPQTGPPFTLQHYWLFQHLFVCMCVQRSILFSRKLASASWSPSCFSKVLGAGISNRMNFRMIVFSCKACCEAFVPYPWASQASWDWSPVDQHPYELQPKSTVMESPIRDIVIYFLDIELGLGKRQYTLQKTITFAIFPKPEKR